MATATFWNSATATPVSDIEAANNGLNLGVVFKANVAGTITHLRYPETTNAAGTVDLRLIDTSGTVLASTTHTAVAGNSGWRDVALGTPYEVTTGTWMMAYYHVPSRSGFDHVYATVAPALWSVQTSSGSELETAADGAVTFAGTTGNGRYEYGALSTPDNTFGAGNYGADVVFETGPVPDPIPVAVDGVGAWVGPASSTAISPAYPASLNSPTAGDRLVAAILVVKPDTATVATPAGWTAAGSQALGGGTQGAGTGAVKVFVFRRVLPAGSTLSGTQAFAITGGSSPVAHIRSWSYNSSGYTSPTWDTALTSTFYSRTTGSTTFGGTGAANLNLTTGDALLYVSASSDDQSSTHTISALAAAGATLSAVTQSPSGTIINAQGNDISAAAAYSLVTAGASTAAPSATVTGSSAETGGGFFWRVRATGIAAPPPDQATVKVRQGVNGSFADRLVFRRNGVNGPFVPIPAGGIQVLAAR